jgi:hypothetical protein
VTLHPDARQFLDVIAVNVIETADRAVVEAGAAIRRAMAAASALGFDDPAP